MELKIYSELNKVVKSCIKCDYYQFRKIKNIHFCTCISSLNCGRRLFKPANQTCDNWKG